MEKQRSFLDCCCWVRLAFALFPTEMRQCHLTNLISPVTNNQNRNVMDVWKTCYEHKSYRFSSFCKIHFCAPEIFSTEYLPAASRSVFFGIWKAFLGELLTSGVSCVFICSPMFLETNMKQTTGRSTKRRCNENIQVDKRSVTKRDLVSGT